MDFIKIDELRTTLKKMRPLNVGEVNRLRDEFIIDNTFKTQSKVIL